MGGYSVNSEVELTLQERVKSQMLYDIFTREAEYSFDLNYRTDMTIEERQENFSKYVKYCSEASIEQLLKDYGEVDAFPSLKGEEKEYLRHIKFNEWEKKSLISFKTNTGNELSLTEEQFISTVKDTIDFAVRGKEYALKDLDAHFIAEDITGILEKRDLLSNRALWIIEQELKLRYIK